MFFSLRQLYSQLRVQNNKVNTKIVVSILLWFCKLCELSFPLTKFNTSLELPYWLPEKIILAHVSFLDIK